MTETNLSDILNDVDTADEPTGEETSDEAATTPVVEANDDPKPEKAGDPKGEAKAEKPEDSEEKGERLRDEQGRFVPKKEAESLKAALRDERRKRQELQQKLESKPEEKKDFFEDPDGALEQRLSRERAEFNNKFFAFSEHHARQRHDDYDEVVSELVEAAADDHTLAQDIYPRASAHVDPAGFLYSQAIQRRELAAVDGDIGKYREGIETPYKAQLSERDKRIAELEKQLAGLGRVKSSMSDESSTSSSDAENDAAAEPTSMDSILSPKRRKAS